VKSIFRKAAIWGIITALLISPTGIMGGSVVLAACGGQVSNASGYTFVPYNQLNFAYLARVGGVSLDKAATFLADMSDVKGAYFDQNTNRIVFVGSKLTSGQTPIFNKDDLAVAIKSVVFNNAIPQVNIGDPNNAMASPWPVTFYGGVENTNFGNVIEKADWSLKQYYMGYTSSGQPISTSVPGYKSAINRFMALNPSPSDASGSGQIWISPQNITLKKDDASSSFVFDQVKMQVQTQLSPGSPAKLIQAYSDFANHMTVNYDSFAQENIWWSKTKELSKIVGVVKWLKDNNIVTDYEWAKEYKPAYVQTATSEQPFWIGPINNGGAQWSFHGGVVYDTANTYTADNGSSSTLKTNSENASPTDESDHWTFTQGGQTFQSVAVSAAAFRSVGTYSTQTTDMSVKTLGDLDLSFTRTYNSLSSTSKEIGTGWDYMPAKLRNLQPNIYISCSPSGGYSGLYPKKLSYETQSGTYETFTYNCGTGYIPDNPSYHSKLNRNSDGSFTVTNKDLSSYKFDIGLNLNIKRDKNNNGLYYHYDGSTNIKRIEDDHGRVININRNSTGVIGSISDWTGRTVTYGYDANDNLVTVKDPRNNIMTYGYDSKNRLVTIKDRQNRTLLTNTYNDDSKLSSTISDAGLTTSFTYDETNKLVTATDANSKITKTYYDDKSRLKKQVDPLNNYVEYTYGNEPSPLTVRDKNNHTTTYAYDSNGNNTSITYPDSKQITKQFNNLNQVTQVSDNRYGITPKVTTNSYDTNGNLLSQNEAGITNTYTYNSQGGLLTSVDGRGATSTYSRNTFGNKSSETSATGNTTTYTYDNLGRVTQILDPSNKTKAYTYDSNNNVLTSDDGSGTTTNIYSVDNKLTKSTSPDNKSIEYTYNSNGSQTQVKDELLNLTNYGYDQYNNLTTRQDALNRTTTELYDALNRKKQSTTPLGKVAKWEYDAVGNITKRIDESNRSTIYEYDNMDRLIKTTYPDASIITYAYDFRGNLTKVISPSGTTDYTYDIYDRLSSEKDPHNLQVNYSYDNSDNMTNITYPGNKTVNYTYDNSNRLSTVTDWNSKQSNYKYNGNGTLSKKRLSNNIVASYEYDSANRLSALTYTLENQLISKFSYVRDGRGNVTKETEIKPATGTPFNIYTESLNSGWVSGWSWGSTINAGNTANPFEGTKSLLWKPNSAYAGLHLRATSGSFNTAPYNAISFSARATQAGQKVALGLKDLSDNELVPPVDISLYGGNLSTTYKTYVIPLSAFNAVNTQILGLNFVENTGAAQQNIYLDNIRFTTATPNSVVMYDDQVTASFGDWSWGGTYDFADTTDPFNGLKAIGANYTAGYGGLSINDWTGYRTNGYGSLSLAVKSTQNNPTIGIQFTDENGSGIGTMKLLNSYGVGPTNTGYTVYEIPVGDLQATDMLVHGLDIQNETGMSPINIKIDDIKLIPNQAGVTTSQDTNFTYDNSGRLLTATYPGRSYTYTYDSVGNRLTSNENGVASTYTVNNDDQMLSKGARNFTYDNQGNEITDGSKVLAYDYDNYLKTWTNPSTSSVIDFVYDGMKNRIEKNINGIKTFQYVNDNTGDLSKVLMAKNITNTTKQIYIYGSELESQGDDAIATRQYYLSDGLGNVRYVTNSTASTLQAYTYDPYGNEVSTGPTSNFTFEEQQKDRETSLDYLRARYYDPSVGRFISRDPLSGNQALPQSQHPYAYAHNNPVNLSDPSGELIPIPILLWSGGVLVGALLSGPDLYNGVKNCDAGQTIVGIVGITPIGRIGTVASAISKGHAAVKHYSEFANIGIKTQKQLEAHISSVMSKPSATKSLTNGRTAYMDTRTKTVIIHDPKSVDQGTAFVNYDKDPWILWNKLN